jgi:hypothetical protein
MEDKLQTENAILHNTTEDLVQCRLVPLIDVHYGEDARRKDDLQSTGDQVYEMSEWQWTPLSVADEEGIKDNGTNV